MVARGVPRKEPCLARDRSERTRAAGEVAFGLPYCSAGALAASQDPGRSSLT